MKSTTPSSALQAKRIFADNASSKKMNMFLFSLLKIIYVQGISAVKRFQISFMTPGHSKCAPDSWFGLFKRLFRQLNINIVFNVETDVSATGRVGEESIGSEG